MKHLYRAIIYGWYGAALRRRRLAIKWELVRARMGEAPFTLQEGDPVVNFDATLVFQTEIGGKSCN